MSQYSPERKAALLKKLLSPMTVSVAELARQEGISAWTLYTWRKEAKAGGASVPEQKNKQAEQWSPEARFAVVLETASLSEIELSEYCRQKGLFPEQVKTWRQACIDGQASTKAQQKVDKEQSRSDKKRIKQLERELHRKEKALAETAALLVLQKKFNAYLGLSDEDD